jgi:5-methylcytosine-specific restriction endonuclease McrA
MARTRNQGMNWIRLTTRLAIYSRDGFACAYCAEGAESGVGRGLTLDHVVPCELGGSNQPSNLVTACLSCNSAKQDVTTRAWFARLRDRGVDTGVIGARIRRQTARKIDRAEGRRLAALRRGQE